MSSTKSFNVLRLINTHNMCMEAFEDNGRTRIPQYAILSHRWGRKEWTFQDYEKDRNYDSDGYKKVFTFCKRAEAYGIPYAWVDTCCIDKTHGSELSSAIRSMFRWYANAHVCFTYLEDFTSSSRSRSQKTSMTDSIWWTRGWTLQELIAPKELIFFDSNWTPLGSKRDLSHAIWKKTRIPINVIEDTTSSLYKQCPHAQRLSWAAGRETTKIEDQAYSLQGLCDTYPMPNYGEGDRAFKKLQLEIMATWTGDSLLAWKSPSHRMHVENTGVLAKSPNEFLVCASLGALGKYSTAGFSPSRNLPLKVNEQSIQLCGSAIPLWPKAGAVQTKSVQKFLGSNSRGQRASAKHWAIPLTIDTRESMTSEYSSILVVAQNDRDPRFFQRVECFGWNPSHERRDQQLAEYYDMGLKEQKIFNLLLDYKESGRR